MALKPAERNNFIARKLSDYIEAVKAGNAPALDRYSRERAVLERLIPINSDGFRGVTLTAILGKFVREDINTSTEFDAINPRSIFENGIYPVLKVNRIPTGKSAPLNVAKNTQVLDEKWAEGRKPETAALAAVDYIRRVNSHWKNEAMRDDLILMFIQRLLRYAEEVASLDVEFTPVEGAVPLIVAKTLSKFALAFPEGGSLPQHLVGALLSQLRNSNSDYSGVGGLGASVFGTNTTSNKPADLWDVLSDGSFGNLYEVTCKSVDMSRLDAAVDSYSKLGLKTAPITFICRVPEDCKELLLTDGVITHRGIPFQFLDFSSFVETAYILLTSDKQQEAFQAVCDFIAEPSRAKKTKLAWSFTFKDILTLV
jgi:hypothetical protein